MHAPVVGIRHVTTAEINSISGAVYFAQGAIIVYRRAAHENMAAVNRF